MAGVREQPRRLSKRLHWRPRLLLSRGKGVQGMEPACMEGKPCGEESERFVLLVSSRSPVASGPRPQTLQSQERPRPGVPQRSSSAQQAVARSSRRPSLHEPSHAPREAVREQRPMERRPPPPEPPTASLSAVSASSASLRSSFTDGLSGIQAKVPKASSEPRLPTCLAYLGVPSRTPRTTTKPQGRGPSSPLVAEWEQAIGERAALYPICAMTPQEAQDWGQRGGQAHRDHHDSSLISAVVFGNPACPERRRTRPGSVDPGLNLPGCVSAGRPTSPSGEGRRTPRSPVSPATRFEDDSISIRSATETDRYTPRARKRVPGLSDSSTVVGELLFQNSHVSGAEAQEEGPLFWEGCAGQPSDSRDKASSKQVATLWDLQGYAGLGLATRSRASRASRASRSEPESPSSQSSAIEATRSSIRVIRGASEGHFRIQEASPLWQGDAEEAQRPNSYRSLHDGAAGRPAWMTWSPDFRNEAAIASSIAGAPSRPDLLSPEPEIFPSPRPRVAIEEGGGPPWSRTASTMSWMDASQYRRAAETSRARAAGVVSGRGRVDSFFFLAGNGPTGC
ncbi:for [Symbiodinium sp. CCMP2456]|nr:for [Symbiodinium sp. CCMP2456]